jgi:hypothetical protein
MHPIDIAHTLAQQRVNARGRHHGPSPLYVQDPWKIAPSSSVTPPEAAATKKRRWRPAWARTLQNHRSPTGNVRARA